MGLTLVASAWILARS